MKLERKHLTSAARSFWGGPLQTEATLVPGVLAVSTPGHGGIVVDPATFPLHPCLQDGRDGNIQRWTWSGTDDEAGRVVGFEEDCSWSYLIALHPELLAPAIRKHWLSEVTIEYVKNAALRQATLFNHPDVVAALTA